MTPSDLEAFRARMGWNRRKLASELEISQDRLRRMQTGGRIPRHIALACTALALGAPPIGGHLVQAILKDALSSTIEYESVTFHLFDLNKGKELKFKDYRPLACVSQTPTKEGRTFTSEPFPFSCKGPAKVCIFAGKTELGDAILATGINKGTVAKVELTIG